MSSEYFNQLSPAELERIALLSEELGEAQQAIGKILRHGYESTNPHAHDDVTNRSHLEKELGDVRFAVWMLCKCEDLNKRAIREASSTKSFKVQEFLHHQSMKQLSAHEPTPSAGERLADDIIELASRIDWVDGVNVEDDGYDTADLQAAAKHLLDYAALLQGGGR